MRTCKKCMPTHLAALCVQVIISKGIERNTCNLACSKKTRAHTPCCIKHSGHYSVRALHIILAILHAVKNLWVQCETLELRFLKCSIKWDVLTLLFSDFCFPSPFFLFLGEHNSLFSLLPPPSPLFIFQSLVFSRFSGFSELLCSPW